MDSIRIVGGKPLQGSIHIHGSKNAALPMMAAAILQEGICSLQQCPRIADVKCMEEILRSLGALVWWEGDTLHIDASSIHKTTIPKEYGKKMRSSIVLLGSLLGRMGKAEIPHPGGCVIGSRPINLHILAISQLGAAVEEIDGTLHVTAKNLMGAEIDFKKFSVGATQNAVLAAVKAKGDTRITGSSSEPEVIWLCRLLQAMGAKIQGVGSSTLLIQGVERLHGVTFQVPGDRIVAGTYVCACCSTRGSIVLENAPIEEMTSLLGAYEKMGGQYTVNGGKLSLCGKWAEKPVSYLETQVFPGFPTDLQSPMMAVLSGNPGSSHIRETVFEDRFKAAVQLRQMGARIFIDGRDARIEGVPDLHGAEVVAEELRGGAALVVAGLGAQGITRIHNRHFIERGYAHICEDLAALGGNIQKD